MIKAGKKANMAAKGQVNTKTLKKAQSSSSPQPSSDRGMAAAPKKRIGSSGAGYNGGRSTYIEHNGTGYSGTGPKKQYAPPAVSHSGSKQPQAYFPHKNRPNHRKDFLGHAHYNPFK